MTAASIIAGITAVAFAATGTGIALGKGDLATRFDAWGYPHGWRWVTSSVELVGAACLIAPVTRPFGLVLLAGVIAFAIGTLIRHWESFLHIMPALIFGCLLLATALTSY